MYCTRHGKCIFADPLQLSHACHRFWKCHKTLRSCSLLTRSTHIPLRLPRGTTSERPKVARTPGVFNMLTSKCASRHNGVHFFDISTSKNGPRMVGVRLCFLLRNVLRATTLCTFSTSQLLKVVREWCAFTFFTSKCASRHNGVHFFDIATSKSGPKPLCF